MKKLLFIVFLLSSVTSTFATGNELRLVAEKWEASKLPSPGEDLQIRLLLKGDKSPNSQTRLLAVIDGKLMDIAVSDITFNDKDELVYTAKVPAPLESISYQFFLMTKEGKSYASERLSVVRECIPLLEVPQELEERIAAGKDEGLKALVEKSKILDEQASLLQEALEKLDELKSVLSTKK